MELTGGRGLYGRGGRPAHLPPGPLPGSLPRNSESYEHDPESSNANQTSDTDEQSPGDVSQSSNIVQTPPYRAERPQTYTPGFHPQDLASQQDDTQASNTYQSSVPNENEQIINEVKQRLEDTLSSNGIQGLPPLEECSELNFGSHSNTSKSSGERYLNQRLYLGSMNRSGQKGQAYMYLVDGRKMKYVVEVETGNQRNHPPTRILLTKVEDIWNKIDLVEPIRTSRMNIAPDSRNYLPYAMLARYYFILHYIKLGEVDFSGRGEFLTEGDFGRYLKTATNNFQRPAGRSRKNRVPKGKKSTRNPLKNQDPIPEDSSSEGHDRLSDEDYPSPGTKRPPRRQPPRRSTTIGPHPHDISNLPYETLSHDELSTLILLASQELRRRGSTPLLDSHSPGTAPQSRGTGHTSMHPALLQGRFADPTDFEEPGPGYSSNYDGPF